MFRPPASTRPHHRGRAGQPRRAGAVVAAVVAAGGLVAACGAEGGGPPTGPTVAPERFDGRFELTELVVDEGQAATPAGIVFEFDAQFGALAVETPCGTLLGSYSLLPDGAAGVTITGARERTCTRVEAEGDEALRAALDRVEAWTEATPGFELRSAGGRDRLRLSP